MVTILQILSCLNFLVFLYFLSQSLLIRVSVLFLQNNCNNGTLWPSGDSVEPVPAGGCGELSTWVSSHSSLFTGEDLDPF